MSRNVSTSFSLTFDTFPREFFRTKPTRRLLPGGRNPGQIRVTGSRINKVNFATSIADPHLFDADPDPVCHDADPDPDPTFHFCRILASK